MSKNRKISTSQPLVGENPLAMVNGDLVFNYDDISGGDLPLSIASDLGLVFNRQPVRDSLLSSSPLDASFYWHEGNGAGYTEDSNSGALYNIPFYDRSSWRTDEALGVRILNILYEGLVTEDYNFEDDGFNIGTNFENLSLDRNSVQIRAVEDDYTTLIEEAKTLPGSAAVDTPAKRIKMTGSLFLNPNAGSIYAGNHWDIEKTFEIGLTAKNINIVGQETSLSSIVGDLNISSPTNIIMEGDSINHTVNNVFTVNGNTVPSLFVQTNTPTNLQNPRINDLWIHPITKDIKYYASSNNWIDLFEFGNF